MAPNDALRRHWAASIFPEMSPQEFDALKEDIRLNGLLGEIVLLDDEVLDGWHRLRACRELGIDPRFRQHQGSDPLGYVLSMNLRRRHLRKIFLSLAAAAASNTTKGGARVTAQNCGLTHEQAAKLFGVGVRMVDEASRFLESEKKGLIARELSDAVRGERISLWDAMKLSHLSLERQREALNRDKRGSKRSPVNRYRSHGFDDRFDAISRAALKLSNQVAKMEAIVGINLDRRQRLAGLCHSLELRFAREAAALEGTSVGVYLMPVEDV
jgi:hypothetical protein